MVRLHHISTIHALAIIFQIIIIIIIRAGFHMTAYKGGYKTRHTRPFSQMQHRMAQGTNQKKNTNNPPVPRFGNIRNIPKYSEIQVPL